MAKKNNFIEREEVVIRFSGDSGDGMQLTGTLFSETAALHSMHFGTGVIRYPTSLISP